MSDKCEWKDGEFEPCDTLNFKCEHEVYSYLKHKGSFCPFCGSDIKKPEPEAIIRKSGGTWVARYSGVDYLCTKPEYRKDLADHPEVINFSFVAKEENNKWWKPISEIEITDEIAKLRCLIVGEDCCFNSQLIAVTSNPGFEYKFIATEPSGSINRFKTVRFATVSDLESDHA